MINNETLREVMLENRTEVMMHTVIPRNINLENFDRQVLAGVRRAGKSYILYGRIQQLIANSNLWCRVIRFAVSSSDKGEDSFEEYNNLWKYCQYEVVAVEGVPQ